MTRLIGWIGLIMGLAIAVGWFTHHPGFVTVQWLGYEFGIQVGILIAGILAGFLVLAALTNLLMKLIRLPSELLSETKENRQSRGIEAVTECLLHLAASDITGAADYAKKAKNVLGDRAIIPLLEAQIAYKKGNRDATVTHLETMLRYSSTRFVAARALSRFAREDDNLDTATEHAEHAHRLHPKDPAALRNLFDLYLLQNKWQQAEHSVKHARHLRRIDARQARRYLALLHLSQAQAVTDDGHAALKQDALEKAVHHDPSLTLATMMYLSQLQGTLKRAKGLRAIHRGWKASPHPALFRAWLEIHEGGPSEKILKRAYALTRSQADHIESQLGLAEAALDAGSWDVARNHLKAALAMAEQPRVYRMLALLEQKQRQDETSAVEWLRKAAQAPVYDPSWNCSQCGHRHIEWTLRCEHCRSFDSVAWQPPKEHAADTTLPLLLAEA